MKKDRKGHELIKSNRDNTQTYPQILLYNIEDIDVPARE